MLAYTPKHPVKTGQPRKNSEFKIQNLELFWAAKRAIRPAFAGLLSLPQISIKERNRTTNVIEK